MVFQSATWPNNVTLRIRGIPHRMSSCGPVLVLNHIRRDGSGRFPHWACKQQTRKLTPVVQEQRRQLKQQCTVTAVNASTKRWQK
jgi:hypothetical protein